MTEKNTNMEKIKTHFDESIKNLSSENDKKMNDLIKMIADLTVEVTSLKNIVQSISVEPKKTKKITKTETKTSEKKNSNSISSTSSTARVSIPSFFKSKCVNDKKFFDKYYALISDDQKEEINKKRNVKSAKSDSEKTQAIAGHLYSLVKGEHGKEIEELKKNEEKKQKDEPVKKDETSDND